MAEHPSTSSFYGEVSSGGSSNRSDVTLPPVYTEMDPYIEVDGKLQMEAAENGRITGVKHRAPSTRTSDRGEHQQSPEQEDLVLVGLKGLIPLTMNPADFPSDSGGSAPTAHNKPYSIYTDPLLMENADTDKTAFCGLYPEKDDWSVQTKQRHHLENFDRYHIGGVHFISRIRNSVQSIWGNCTVCLHRNGPTCLDILRC